MTLLEYLSATASVVVIVGGLVKCWRVFNKRYRIRWPIEGRSAVIAPRPLDKPQAQRRHDGDQGKGDG